MRTQATETTKRLAGGTSRPISRAEYNALMTRLEDVEDALDLMRAQEAGQSADAWPDSLCARLMAGEHPVRLWREHRGLTLKALSRATGIASGYLSEIESGKKPGSAVSLKKCAIALGVDMDDLVRDK